MKSKPVFIIILSLSVLGFLGVMVATRWGIGISPDSTFYIYGARNLVAGWGLSIQTSPGNFEAFNHHAPLYSLLLALIELIGFDILFGARVLNAFFFSLNIFLVGVIIRRSILPGNIASLWIPVLGSLLTLSSFVMIDIHSMAWTEPAFIAFSLIGFYWLGWYLDTSHRRYFYLAAIAIALAALTRYAGLAVILTCILGILFLHVHSWKLKIGYSLLFGLLSTLPLLLWLSRNWISSGTTANREIAFHPITVGHLKNGLTTIASWFLIPETVSGYIKILPVLFLLILVMVFLVLQRPGGGKETISIENAADPIPGAIKLFSLFIPVYFLFLVGSITFLDANTPLSSRILSPVFVIALILTLFFLARVWEYVKKYFVVRLGFTLICITWAAIFLFGGITHIITSYKDGLGFNSAVWHRSEIISEVARIPAEQAIYTNAPEAIYIHTGRWAFGLPMQFDSVTQRPNDQYIVEMGQMSRELRDKSGVIIYFSQLYRPAQPTEDELTRQLPLVSYIDKGDGVIYRWAADH